MADRLRAQLAPIIESPIGNVDEVGRPATSFDRTGLDDLSREVFGVLGIPLDVLDLKRLLHRIGHAVDESAPFLLSTPNVNFLMLSRSDAEFRESLLLSDLCPVDGMPLVWIGRLLGIPIEQRLSGSDIFDALRMRRGRRLKVFLLGGAEGVAATVGQSLNRETGGMTCVGVLNPGFGSVSEMSTAAIFGSINASHADLLAVFLSAKKAQSWLLRNHERLQIPIRAQFGATINLQAGSVKRAPLPLQKLGLEWLWRIKEEPYLWQRYWKDGCGLLWLVLTCVLPLAIRNAWTGIVGSNSRLTIDRNEDQRSLVIKLSGAAVARHVDAATADFRSALQAGKKIVIDLTNVRVIDPRFFGLLLMLRKQAIRQGLSLEVVGATPTIRKIFRLNGFEFLLRAKT